MNLRRPIPPVALLSIGAVTASCNEETEPLPDWTPAAIDARMDRALEQMCEAMADCYGYGAAWVATCRSEYAYYTDQMATALEGATQECMSAVSQYIDCGFSGDSCEAYEYYGETYYYFYVEPSPACYAMRDRVLELCPEELFGGPDYFGVDY